MSEVEISYKTGGGAASFKPGVAERAPRRNRIVSPALIVDVIALCEAGLAVFTAWAVKYIYLETYLGAAKATAPYVGLGVILATLLFASFHRLDLYALPRLRHPLRQVPRLLFGLSGAFLVLIAALYVLKEAEGISRGWMLLWFAALGVTLALWRVCLPAVFRIGALKEIFRQRVAVYGAEEFGNSVASQLEELEPDVRIVGVYDERSNTRGHTARAADGDLDALIELTKEDACDQVVVAVPLSDTRLGRIMDRLGILPVDVRLCPDTMNLPLRVLGVSHLGRLQLLDVQHRPISGRNHYIKRAMDFGMALLGLAIALPFFPLIALAIKLDSPGPVFFRQRRNGYNHQLINILKFRTMTVMEDGPNIRQARANDPRITRVGRFLRKTNFDELPQLFNVLRGEMALIGPRPHALAHDEYYAKLVERYGGRLRVKPGITGWAQVNGFSGETSDPELMRARVEHDLYYIENWSVWLDIEIILRTVAMAVTGRLVH